MAATPATSLSLPLTIDTIVNGETVKIKYFVEKSGMYNQLFRVLLDTNGNFIGSAQKLTNNLYQLPRISTDAPNHAFRLR